MKIQNRVLRTQLAVLGLLTVLLLFVMLLFMSYPYRDEHDKGGSAYNFLPGLDLPDDALFVGHVNPSTTCYCAAWAAASFYGGSYALAGEPSPETAYVIDRFGFGTPQQFVDVYKQTTPMVLIDHNQASQSPAFTENFDIFPVVEGIIDSHGVQDDFISTSIDGPMALDFRPWGSTATIVYYQYYERHRTPSKDIARCLLSSIYSDTVGLEGPTTTEHDKIAAEKLTPIAKLSREELTIDLINARVPSSDASIEDVLNIDAKIYQFAWEDDSIITLKWSCFDTSDPDYILQWKSQFLKEMQKEKKDKNLDFYFLSVVNTLEFFENGKDNGISTLLLPSEDERNAAVAVYGGALDKDGSAMDVSPMMSRKLQFLPPLSSILSDPPFSLFLFSFSLPRDFFFRETIGNDFRDSSSSGSEDL